MNMYGVATGPNVILFGCTVNGHTFGPVDPYAQYILKTHMPLPDYSGTTTKADQENNYITSRYQFNWYKAFAARIDHQINDPHSIFGHWYQSNLNEPEEVSFNKGLGSYFYRKNRGLDIDDVYMFSPSLFSIPGLLPRNILNLRLEPRKERTLLRRAYRRIILARSTLMLRGTHNCRTRQSTA